MWLHVATYERSNVMHTHRYDVQPEQHHASPSVTSAAFAVSTYCPEANGVGARRHLLGDWKSAQ